ncbi:MAG: hypothetical protein Q7S18_00810 [bacterium]|nr:hypothetical protein [bacterium]
MKVRKIKSTLLIFTGLVILSFAFFSIAQENSESNKNIFEDSDQDGLSNAEEKTYGTNPNNPDTDGDGYSDGVEIKSGYDPLKPSPGDKIVKDAAQNKPDTSPTSALSKVTEVAGSATEKNPADKNLTQELSTKVAALINSSDSEKKDIKIEDIDALISDFTNQNQSMTFEDLPKIDEKKIKIKKQEYAKLTEADRKAREKDDTLKYLTAAAYIMAANSPQKISSTDDLGKLSNDIVSQVANFSASLSDISYFENLAAKGADTLKQLEEVEVPQNFLDIHVKALQVATYAVSLKNEAKPNAEDPVSTIVSVSRVQNLLILSESLFNEIQSRLSDLGIAEIPFGL